MLIDCDRCEIRGHGCADCAVTALLGPPSVTLDTVHARAIDVLDAAGMLPPLRLAVVETTSAGENAAERSIRLVDTPTHHLPGAHAVG